LRREAGVGLLVLALASVARGGEAKAVRVVNPGFELDADSDGVPDGWFSNRGMGSGGCPVTVDRTVKKEGLCSARLGSARPTCGWLTQELRVEPGAVYRASAWVRTEKLSLSGGQRGAFRACFAVRPVVQAVLGRGRQRAGTTEWAEEVVDFIAPRDGKAVLWCFFAGRVAGSGSVWFDDVQVVRLAPPGGIGSLKERPRSGQALAEWAVRRTPPDWQSLLAAMEAFYNGPDGREDAWIVPYLERLKPAVQAQPKLRARLDALCAVQAWRMEASVLEGRQVGDMVRDACRRAASDPKHGDLAASARLGLARMAVLEPGLPVAAAAEAVRKAVGGEAPQRRRLLAVLLSDAGGLHRSGATTRAARLYDVLVTALPVDDPARAYAELSRLKFFLAVGDTGSATRAAESLAGAEWRVPPGTRKVALATLARLSVESGDLQGGAKWVSVADQRLAAHPASCVAVHLEHARALVGKERWEEAAAACQRVPACLPQETQGCSEAQQLLVRCLMAQRRHDEALAAAKVLYGVAPNSEKEITQAVNLVMQALKAKYRSIALANDFVAFQSHGPNGEDGKKGTEDDVANPLAKVQWTPPPEIEALFKKTVAGLPQDFQGRRWRGYLYLYWGKPELAIKEFAWRYDRAPLEQKAVDEAIDDLVVALKACHGHALAGERFLDYQKYGPKGRDGKAGSADDLTDPLKGILKER